MIVESGSVQQQSQRLIICYGMDVFQVPCPVLCGVCEQRRTSGSNPVSLITPYHLMCIE